MTADHPLLRLLREAQVGADSRQRDEDDVEVERVDQLREREEGEDPSGPDAPGGRGGRDRHGWIAQHPEPHQIRLANVLFAGREDLCSLRREDLDERTARA